MTSGQGGPRHRAESSGESADATRAERGPWLINPTEVAVAIRSALAEHDPVTATRFIGWLVDQWRDRAHHGTPEQIDAFLAPVPPSTGDQRWDLLLAAIIRTWTTRWSVTPPPWTDGLEPLQAPWGPVDRVRTPVPELAELNLMIDATWFHSA